MTKRPLAICLLLAFACTGLALCSVKVKPPGRFTAKEVCPFAMRKAYEWDHRGQLIFVTSRPIDFRLDGRSSRWGFRCVSADGVHVAAFSVDMAHANAPVRVSRNVKRPPDCRDIVNEYRWRIDSPEACSIAKRNGLDAWVAKHPTFDPSYTGNRFELAANKTDGPYWRLEFCAKPIPASRKYDRMIICISAVDGRVISSTTKA